MAAGKMQNGEIPKPQFELRSFGRDIEEVEYRAVPGKINDYSGYFPLSPIYTIVDDSYIIEIVV